MKEIIKDISILWNYLCLNTKPKRSECIIGLGNILTLVPKKCAELYKQGLGDYIIFSGNCGKGTEGIITKTEAEMFRNIAIEEGVPTDKIFIEPNATNTYENYKYSKKLLIDNHLDPDTFLIVGKPYQERRALAIGDIELSDKKIMISSFNMKVNDFLEYVKSNKLMKVEDVINELVGEINLIIITPQYGLQSYQQIPNEVVASYKKLISLGFNKYVYDDKKVKDFKNKMTERWI